MKRVLSWTLLVGLGAFAQSSPPVAQTKEASGPEARFDGKWLTTMTCPQKGRTKGYTWELAGVVKDSNFRPRNFDCDSYRSPEVNFRNHSKTRHRGSPEVKSGISLTFAGWSFYSDKGEGEFEHPRGRRAWRNAAPAFFLRLSDEQVEVLANSSPASGSSGGCRRRW
jgi:hypothetical protein